MENNYLLSIVIPTRNRMEYAFKVVCQILSIKDERLQVVVQDNSDTDELASMFSQRIKDLRLKYNYSSDILSFVDNFGAGVENVDGEYICMIGDDDGVNPEIMRVVEWASKNNVDAIKPEQQAIYLWGKSGVHVRGLKNDDGILNISKITCQTKLVTPSTEVSKLMMQGCHNYLKLDLAKLYHGIIRKKCIVRVKENTGHYFGGLSPDIYSAVALSLVIDKLVCIDYPLTISGICSRSGSADSATGKHTGKIENAPHFRGHNEYHWASEVPEFYSVETIWADSAIAAIREMKEEQYIKDFNLARLTVYSLYKNHQFSSIILKHYRNICQIKGIGLIKSNLLLLNYFISGPLTDFMTRIRNRLLRRKGDFVRFQHVNNIDTSIQLLLNNIHNNNHSIDDVLTKLNSMQL